MPPFGLCKEGNAENFHGAREQLINELKLAPFVNGGGARKRLKCLECGENSAERKMFDCRCGKTCSVRRLLKSEQISSLKNRVKRKLGHTNQIGDLKKKINNLPDDILILASENEEGEVYLGAGTDAGPFLVGGFTNISALRRYAEANTTLNEKIIMHFDETFKVSEIRYQVIVFGLSDINGQFHVAGLEVSSHRRATEYKTLMSKFADVLMQHEQIPFQPSFLMSDCSSAISNAVIAAIEEGSETPPLVLMCSFHVMKAIKAKFDEYPMQHEPKVDLWITQVKPILNEMTKPRCDGEFSQKSKLLKRIVLNNMNFAFWKYWDETWLSNPVWSYWQTYHTPPGYACTNNAVESFNKFFKRDYTLKKHHPIGMVMGLCIEALRDFTNAESQQKPFMTKGTM
ncbi:hypothetical protein ROZALSC1DRAFT_28827 [Rozella allomycis CSF55]|uniref:MULE transposase domain-containing protein n=1 Tax=Rozella allomycis (strain CSF55) TaxID=988480 RepID=A0A4P9YJ58_ROZAC|nr:hypothetical protein ROZALSC1DRAFT_28827 [Rozella allomycis CSF55]